MRFAQSLAARAVGAVGDGGTRVIRFLEPMTVSILADNRHCGAFGMAGGEAGQAGRNWVEHMDGTRLVLDHIGQAAGAGQAMCWSLRRLGGGGYGIASSVRRSQRVRKQVKEH